MIRGSFGEYGTLIGATIWLIFILMLIYGLHNNRAVFVLVHLIACVSDYATHIHVADGHDRHSDRPTRDEPGQRR